MSIKIIVSGDVNLAILKMTRNIARNAATLSVREIHIVPGRALMTKVITSSAIPVLQIADQDNIDLVVVRQARVLAQAAQITNRILPHTQHRDL